MTSLIDKGIRKLQKGTLETKLSLLKQDPNSRSEKLKQERRSSEKKNYLTINSLKA